MLASITPLGERSRRRRWSETFCAFCLAASAAGAAAGGLCGEAGYLVLGGMGDGVRLLALGVILLGTAVGEVMRLPVPGPRRQVDERWLNDFRAWVYGAGYGAQLGVGVATIVSSPSLYAAFAAAFLTASAATGAVVLGAFGLVRGLTLLLGARVRDPAALRRLHARLAARREPWRRVELAVIVLLAAGVLARAAA
jgi:sulfite exporter TauE/SafE